MKAIISNGKRMQIYSQELKLANLKEFIASEFPRMSNVAISFKDKHDNIIKIEDESHLQIMSQIYQGQNFVQIDIEGKFKGNEHDRKRNKQDQEMKNKEEDKKGFANQAQRRTFVLSKACGGSPLKYLQFVQSHKDLKIGQLIKLYSEQNGIKKTQCKNPAERRSKVLARVFNGEPSDFIDYQEKYSNLNIGQLIKQYSEEKGLPLKEGPNFAERPQNRRRNKLNKLSKFFEKPQEQFIELVEKNPQLNFKQLLDKLKEEQGIEIDQEKLRNFRKKQQSIRMAKRQAEEKPESKPKSQKAVDLREKRSPKKENQSEKNQSRVHKKQQEMRTKGKILMTMKDMFGQGKGKQYFKFIEQNLALGQQGILDKWITLHYE